MTKKKDNLKVLLIEDNDDLRVLWEAALSDEFNQVLSASDGKAGLEMAAFCSPDVILSDILLPKLDGFGLCNQLKLSTITYRIPVILYSAAFIDEKDKQLALGYGAARILQKSISIQELISLTREVVIETQFSHFVADIGESIEQQDLTELHVERMSEKLTDLLSEINSQRDSLRTSLDRFRDFASNLSDYFWETDADGKLVFATAGRRSKLTLPYFSYDGESMFSYFAKYFDADNLQQLCHQLRSGDEIETHLAYTGKDGSSRIVQATAKPYFDGSYQLAGYRGVFSDITERHRRSEQLYHEASHDQLTGLLNRRGLERGYAEAVSSASAESEHVLCFIDLDNFKAVNDTAGHMAGDQLLVSFAKLLQQTARKTDLVVRLGGDEFALLMPNCDSHASRRLINALHKKVSDFNLPWRDKKLNIDMSLGCVVSQGCDAPLGQLLNEADKACYEAKQSGLDHVSVYSGSPTLTQQIDVARNDLTLEKFKDALRHSQFTLVKQPLIEIDKQPVIIGYETLLRLKDGPVTLLPAMILSIAEEYSMSVALDRWVVANSLQWFVADARLAKGRETISINLTSSSVCDNEFVGDLLKLVHDNDIDPARVAFEISEQTLHDFPFQTRTFIEKLKAVDCQLVLDNFGGGLASLANLTGLKVDKLKLSSQLIRGLERSDRQQEIVSSVRKLADVIGMQVIAQNVDSPEASRLLLQAGIDWQQGDYFSEPVELSQPISTASKHQQRSA